MLAVASDVDGTDLVQMLGAQIMRGEFSGVSDLFRSAGASAPFLLWNPDTRMLQDTPIHRFAEECDRLSAGVPGGALRAGDFDLDAFGAMQDWIMVLMRDGPDRWQYTHVGQGIVRYYGEDRTGTDPTRRNDHIGIYAGSLHWAVAARRERILSLHQPPRQVFVSMSRRLIIPLLSDDAAAECVGAVMLNQPTHELRDGLEVVPTPVLIADQSRIVRYANKDARQRFDGGSYGPWNRRLFDYSGLDLPIDESPEQILRYGIRRQRDVRSVHHQQIGRFNASVSALRHHGEAFYLLLLQPEGP